MLSFPIIFKSPRSTSGMLLVRGSSSRRNDKTPQSNGEIIPTSNGKESIDVNLDELTELQSTITQGHHVETINGKINDTDEIKSEIDLETELDSLSEILSLIDEDVESVAIEQQDTNIPHDQQNLESELDSLTEILSLTLQHTENINFLGNVYGLFNCSDIKIGLHYTRFDSTQETFFSVY